WKQICKPFHQDLVCTWYTLGLHLVYKWSTHGLQLVYTSVVIITHFVSYLICFKFCSMQFSTFSYGVQKMYRHNVAVLLELLADYTNCYETCRTKSKYDANDEKYNQYLNHV
ncbi:MAG: hypothetical protein ACKPKO_03460, partial [Candidatus Fonsibacter sp.]